jgi:hypothetical protein
MFSEQTMSRCYKQDKLVQRKRERVFGGGVEMSPVLLEWLAGGTEVL